MGILRLARGQDRDSWPVYYIRSALPGFEKGLCCPTLLVPLRALSITVQNLTIILMCRLLSNYCQFRSAGSDLPAGELCLLPTCQAVKATASYGLHSAEVAHLHRRVDARRGGA